MSYIHFKFVYKNTYDKVTFDGVNLTLPQLKKLIVEKSKLTQNKQLDYDLEITNADTNEVYKNDTDLINKNSRVNVKRIMKSSTAPLRAQPPKITTPSSVISNNITTLSTNNNSSTCSITNTSTSTNLASNNLQTSIQSTVQPVLNTIQTNTNEAQSLSSVSISQSSNVSNSNISKSDYDSLAPLNLPSKPIFYLSESSKTSVSPNGEQAINILPQIPSDDSRQDEKAKLESILFSSMNASSSMMGGYGCNQIKSDANPIMNSTGSMQHMNRFPGATNNWAPRMINMQQIRPQMPQMRPQYICTICKKPGHPKSLCPEAGSLPKPEERPKFPSGIPKNKMRLAKPDDKFAMLGPDGYVVPVIEYEVAQTVKKDKTPFLTEEEEEEEKRKHLEKLAANGNIVIDSSLNKCPPELKCPFGDHIIKDAVLVPCCGHFICCDECIKKKISNDEYVECPHKDCDQEIGSLESITPYHDMRKRVNDYLNDLKQRASQNVLNLNENSLINKSNASTDAFFDLLLDDVKNEDTNPANINIDYDDLNLIINKTPKNDDEEDKLSSGASSPVQDSNISSSAAAEAAAALKQNLNLNDESKLNDKIDNKQTLDSNTNNIINNTTTNTSTSNNNNNNNSLNNTTINNKPLEQISNQSTALLPTPPFIDNNKLIQPPIIQQPTLHPPMNPTNSNTNIRPILPNPPMYDMNLHQPPPGAPFMMQSRPPMIPPNGNFPPQQFQQYQPNNNLNFNPRYPLNNSNMRPQQTYRNNNNNNSANNNPNMMIPPPFMNNMMMNRPLQYPPTYPGHLQSHPPQNYSNGPMVVAPNFGIPSGNLPPPGVIGSIPPPGQPFNGIPPPQQTGNPLISPSILHNPPLLPPNMNPNLPQLPLMTEAEFYQYREKLKREEEMKNRNNRNRKSKSTSRSHSRSRSYSSSSTRSYSSRSYSSRSRSRSYSRSRSNSRTRRTRRSNSRSDRNNRNKGISNNYNNDKYRNNKNKRDFYRRRSNSRSNRRSKSRSKTTITSRTAVNKDYYHYRQNHSRSRSRSPPSRYSNRRSRSRSASPNNRYNKSTSKRNNSPQSSSYRRPNEAKSTLVSGANTTHHQPQVISSSINRQANVSDSSMENISSSSESSLKLRSEQAELERKKPVLENNSDKKLASSVVIKREESTTYENDSKKRRHSRERTTNNKPVNDRKPAGSNFSIEDDFAIKIDAANSRTVISRLTSNSTKTDRADKEGSVLSSVSSDSRENASCNKKTIATVENGTSSKHKHHHKSKKKSKHKHRSPSKSSSHKIQV